VMVVWSEGDLEDEKHPLTLSVFPFVEGRTCSLQMDEESRQASHLCQQR
jgi:hypothetical protein